MHTTALKLSTLRLVTLVLAVAGCGLDRDTSLDQAASAGAPVIQFTIDDQTDLVRFAGRDVRYDWSVTNAIAVRSEYAVSNGGDGCGNTGGPWAINTESGSLTATIQGCQAGSTYTLTVIATGPDGQEVRQSSQLGVADMKISATGRGCADGHCVWITGDGFGANAGVVVRDTSWTPLHTYSAEDLYIDAQSEPEAITLRYATDAEWQAVFYGNGLIVTVFNEYDWDSAPVAAF